MKWLRLKYQLKRRQAHKKEVEQLSGLAKQISRTALPDLKPDSKARIAAEIGFHQPRYPYALRYSLSALLVVLVATFASAQYAEPGTALYNVKVGTDHVRSLVERNLPIVAPSPSIDSGENETKLEAIERQRPAEERGKTESSKQVKAEQKQTATQKNRPTKPGTAIELPKKTPQESAIPSERKVIKKGKIRKLLTPDKNNVVDKTLKKTEQLLDTDELLPLGL